MVPGAEECLYMSEGIYVCVTIRKCMCVWVNEYSVSNKKNLQRFITLAVRCNMTHSHFM